MVVSGQMPNSERRQYAKRATEFVIAVQLDLVTAGFTYEKWGGIQTCKPGDWLVLNNGETYTVDQETFARTYRASGPGTYIKTSVVWAVVAREAGRVTTKEGETSYAAGDYLVFNEPDGGDAYAVEASAFNRMYKLV